MAYYIDIECLNCHHKFKVDAANYANKKISFNCKNCGNRISYFVPPGYDGLSAPKSEISTTKVKKVKEAKKKEQKSDLQPSAGMNVIDAEGLKIKLPSIFKKKSEKKQAVQIQDNPVMDTTIRDKITTENIISEDKKPINVPPRSASDAAMASGIRSIEQNPEIINIQNTAKPSSSVIQNNVYLSPKVADFEATGEAEIPDFLINKPKTQTHTTAKPLTANPDLDTSMVHVPKPGMPFIAQISTPTFYKAGSYKRKDYSFIIAELSRFRTAIGKTSRQNSLSSYKTTISSEQEKESISTNIVDRVEEETYIPSIDQVSEPAAEIPLQQSQVFNPPTPYVTSGDVGIEQPIFVEQPIIAQSAPQFPIPDFQPLSDNKGAIPAEKASMVSDAAKIYIPINLNQSPEQELKSQFQAKPIGLNLQINPESENLTVPEVEIIDDEFTSVMQPAQSKPSSIFEKPQNGVTNISTPSTSAAFLQNGPGVIHKSQERIPSLIIPQPHQIQSQANFHKNTQIPEFNGQEGNIIPPPSIPLYSTEPPPQMNPPIPAFYPSDNAVIPNSAQTNIPFQVQIPFNQQQPYDKPQGYPNQGAPILEQEQTVTQRMPHVQQVVSPERPSINPPGVINPMFIQEQTVTQRMPPFQQGVPAYRPPVNPSGTIIPEFPQGATPSQPPFQQQVNITGSPSSYQASPMHPFQPQPVAPVIPVNVNEMSPIVQNSPEPVPPPSVTSPKIAGSVKKPIIDEDEDEQFGPSNFGLDF